METSFWIQKWEKKEIGFHVSEANPLLVKYFKELSLPSGSRIFVPLCGKTLDISWLMSQGYRVVGAELSEIAIEELFTELGLEPTITERGKIKHYSAKNIDIFGGDIFELTDHIIGTVDAIYDRAALVALPKDLRNKYTLHLRELTQKAPQLLICYVYDQRLLEGPPFSISDEEVKQHYGDDYALSLLAGVNVAGGIKGKGVATEHVWLLQNEG